MDAYGDSADSGGLGRQWLAAALPGGVLLVSVGRFVGATIDDAYITARYAANLVAGHGPVFNVGERVEGYSNPLWLAVMAAGEATGVGAISAAKVAGVAAAVALLVFLHRTWRAAGLTAWTVAVLLLLVVQPPLVVWSVAGLETVAYALSVVAAVVLAARRDGRGWPAGMLAGAALMLRPEGAAIAVLVGATVLICSGWRRAWLAAVAGAAVAGPYIVFRLWFFGELLPNTYMAKAGGADEVNDGLSYLVGSMANPAAAALVALAIIGGVVRRRNPTVAASLVALGTTVVFVLWAGGDWMPAGRFAVPVLTLAAVPAAWGVDWLVGVLPERRIVAVAVATATAAAAAGGLWAVDQTHAAVHWYLSDGLDSRLALGADLREDAAAGAVVAYGDMGALPYTAGPGVSFVDTNGLVSRQVGELLHVGRKHHVDDLVLANQPDAIILLADRNGHHIGPLYGIRDEPQFLDVYERVLTVPAFPPGAVPDYPEGRYLQVYTVDGRPL